MTDINHPRHYNMGGEIDEAGSAKYEAIKLIEDIGWGFDFCMGNAVKHVLRAPHKGDELGDLSKARWYLERAKRHRGSVRALTYRRIDAAEATAAWLLTGEHERLAATIVAIFDGNAYEALNELNVYMVKFNSSESESG